MEEIIAEGYDIKMVPETANNDMKTGVTFKGSEAGYLEGHKVLKEVTKRKGDRYIFNGIEISISDVPKNKPINIEVKPKGGLSGKANLTIFERNKGGGATIMVSKVKGGDSDHAKILGTKVIKFILDQVIEGNMKEENIPQYRIKNNRALEIKVKTPKTNKCNMCEKDFPTEQGLKSHVTRMHRAKGHQYCEICRITCKDEGDFKNHIKLEHEEIVSPQAKKRKRDLENESRIEDESENDGNLKILEKESWEESRMNHREIETQVNEDELEDMEEFTIQNRKSKINLKIISENKKLEKEHDEKVLEKQISWFEEEVKFQEMKRQITEDRMKEDKKRKRQISTEKKKKSKVKREKSVKDNYDEVVDLVKESKKDEESNDTEGPGYMGWKSEEENDVTIMKAFQDIRKNIQSMDMKIEQLNREKTEQRKDITNLKNELKNWKAEYKQCLEALSNETYEKNRLQTVNQVLKDTLEAKNMLKQSEDKNDIENSEEEMLVEEEDSAGWKKANQCRRKRTNYIEKCELCNLEFRNRNVFEEHIKKNHEDNTLKVCINCQEKFKTDEELQTHVVESHSGNSENKCNRSGEKCDSRHDLEQHNTIKHVEVACIKCQRKFQTTTELQNHIMETHREVRGYECSKCENVLESEEELKHHTITIHAENVFNCQICDKPYTSMSLLRRHDWRCHRAIDCNMCGEVIKSRVDIKTHREIKHSMNQKVYCKYYPSCLDGDECLFIHESGSNGESVCPEGESCNNQSCNYNEQSHTKSKSLCMYQANCNRLNCHFRHTVPRKVFLEVGSRNHQIY